MVLHAALQNKDLRIVESLLGHGTDVDAKDKFRSRLLEKVLDDDHIEALRLFIKREVNINTVDQCSLRYQWTPLHGVSANGQLEVVRLFLQNGAEVNAADALGWTALHGASLNGHVKVTKILLENATNINTKKATLRRCTSRRVVLLRHRADVRLRGTRNQSQLRIALRKDHNYVTTSLAGNLEG